MWRCNRCGCMNMTGTKYCSNPECTCVKVNNYD